MTDRIHSLTVILERDMREDDAQRYVDAFLCFRGVAEVRPNISATDHIIARAQARGELRKVIGDTLLRDDEDKHHA